MKAILLIMFCCFCNGAFCQDIQWQKLYGGSAIELPKRILQLGDGGYLVAAITYSTDGDLSENTEGRNVWLLRLDEAGEIVWQNWFGTMSSGSPPLDLKKTQNGFIIVTTVEELAAGVDCMLSEQNGWIFEIDHSGIMLWQKCYGGSLSDNSHSIEPAGGGYIVGGASNSSDGNLPDNHGSGDIWIFKISDEGDVNWSKNYGGTLSEGARSIIPVSTGGYLVAANIRSTDLLFEGCNSYSTVNNTAALLKLDIEGGLVWVKCFGGNNEDFLHRVIEAADGTFWIMGTTRSNDGEIQGHHGEVDGWIIRMDQQGDLIDQKVFGGSGMDVFQDFALLPDGRIVVGGYTGSSDGDIISTHGAYDAWILVVDEDLEIVWQQTYGGSASDIIRTVSITDDGGFIFSGSSNSTDGDLPVENDGTNLWIVKVGPLDTGIGQERSPKPLLIQPNPVADVLHVQLEAATARHWTCTIFDATGREVMHALPVTGSRVTLPVHGLSGGTYLLRAVLDGEAIYTRFVKQ